ncbi:carboxymuconolactone decarboxylase family protein [Cryobacterium lyxosi]
MYSDVPLPEKYIHAGSLGEPLLALMKIRALQINGCAYCLGMHRRDRLTGIDRQLHRLIFVLRSELPSCV